MTDDAVTVLVPVYNTQKYLRHCLDSLAAQTLSSIKFLCIDDGSTDESAEILSEYANADDRFEIISKQNSGYGASMNRGLDACSSKYVGIVEPDDFADSHMFENLFFLAEETGAEVVKSNYYEHRTGDLPRDDRFEESLDFSKFLDSDKATPYGDIFSARDDSRILWCPASIWSGLYRLDYLKGEGVRFLETPGASFQDTSFNLRALMGADRIALDKRGYLHYRIDNANSSVKSADKSMYICDEYEEAWRYVRLSQDRYSTFSSALAGVQFKAYCWNQWRLARRFREGFFNHFYAEFKTLEKNGVLDRSYFSEYDWNDINQLLNRPDQFFQRVCGALGIEKTTVLLLDHETSEAAFRRFVSECDETTEVVVYRVDGEAACFDLAPYVAADRRIVLADNLIKDGEIDFLSLRGESIRFAYASEKGRRHPGLFSGLMARAN